jgi:hypothetical protein
MKWTEEDRRKAVIGMFERGVLRSEPATLSSSTVWLECGHVTEVVCYRPCRTMPCAQCINEFVKRSKQERSGDHD